MFTAALFTIVKIWKQPKCVSTEAEKSMVVARDWCIREMGDVGQRIHAFSSKNNKFWGSNV